MKLLTFFILLILSACSSNSIPPLPAGDPLAEIEEGKGVAKVGGSVIHEGYLDVLGKINPRLKGQLENPAAKKQLVDNLLEQEMMYAESVKRGVDRQKEVAQKAALYKRVIIAQSLLEKELEDKAKEYYEKNRESEFTKVEVSHIQFNFKPATEKPEVGKKELPPTAAQRAAALAKANVVKAKLASGADFVKMVEEYSDDKISQKKGGSLGAVNRDDKRLARRGMEAAAELVFKMKKGEISDPIESKKGYHLLTVTSDPSATPFDEALKVIRFQIQKEVKDNLLANLKKDYKIVYLDKSLEAPPPPPTPPAMPALPSTPIPSAPGPEGTKPKPQAAIPAEKEQVFYKPGTTPRQGEDAH